MVIVVDNYDSFTHNLVHALAAAGASSMVLRHDAVDVAALLAARPDGIVISAGPCTPAEAGISVPLVRALLEKADPGPPLLGVCLGHQCLAAALGATVRRAAEPMHGRTSLVSHDGRGLFAGIASPFAVARYNSLVVDAIPDGPLAVCARDEAGDVMALRHVTRPLDGVQFHPESHLGDGGAKLLRNWVARLTP